jgi:CRP-like cAMP-binding protein
LLPLPAPRLTRLVGVERRVLELGRRSAFERLVQLLLRESDEQQSSVVRLTQAGVAMRLGLSRQTVSRILGELERQQLLERRRGQILIGDHGRLERPPDPHPSD